MNLHSRKMGIHEWSYSSQFDPSARRQMMHVPLAERFADLGREVELGFDAEQTAQEVERCLNCDIQTVFTDNLCIECDACLDICPTACLSIVKNGEREDLVPRLKDRARNGEGREFLRALRPVRGALSHGGLGHAEVAAEVPLRPRLRRRPRGR